jgi:hypothetical protein
VCRAWGVLLKYLRLSLLLITAALFSATAWAEGIDPKVIIQKGGGSVPIVGNSFSFTVDSSGGGLFDFIAPTTGEDIFSLALIFSKTPTTGPFNCGTGGFFATCGFTFNSDGTVTALFSGASEDEPELVDDACEALGVCDTNDVNGGIEEGQDFGINLGTSGWVPGEKVTGFTNVPEPSMLALLLAGLGFAAGGVALLKRPN